jgi:gas vesicle protein
MDAQIQTHARNGNQLIGFLAGLLMGSLAGAGVTLLLAPQSGKETRAMFQQKGIELKGQATAGIESAEEAVAQFRVKAQHITDDILQRADELRKHGQQMVDEHMERSSTPVEAG